MRHIHTSLHDRLDWLLEQAEETGDSITPWEASRIRARLGRLTVDSTPPARAAAPAT